ncbi:hypothetical protein CORC01_01475 [Colletotrichum orchidophilum]|uniref:Uncharacterized protein n=1 Tax=Colletotrichum orchidophilum TaxID=1209926 RepID=A0A1G4BNQ0_9PEZI|nr:uncharacterized protein CORC01_01475 [Colletotrichum orchidophilum]OHF03091.1 hypothetical protein CORC01_01475 [Colletotrichum orchidophilum]
MRRILRDRFFRAGSGLFPCQQLPLKTSLGRIKAEHAKNAKLRALEKPMAEEEGLAMKEVEKRNATK